ncbi:MAG TPA: hypothetical protein VHM19_04790 [Polyangiales bacterium]|jgi:hypothetical protein|nr:hypothetical protein [Polyangiales bacterium]
MRRARALALACLLILPLGELAAHARIVNDVVPDRDWAAAAAFVKHEWHERDLLTSAPRWTDPLLRLHAGSLISLDMAGRNDDAAYERLWVLSVRGALPDDVPPTQPAELDRSFGKVRVLRYALGKSPVLFDFVDALPSAHASLGDQPCPYHKGGVPRGGGLGKGVLYPLAESFECDPRRPWIFVGRVVLEDLELRPRRCIWQHPAGDQPVSSTFDDVPFGEALVLYAGIYYEHERMRDGGPAQLAVQINGTPRGTLVHHDGAGFQRLSIDTHDLAGTRGQVRIEISAHNPDRRSMCWAATTRAAGDDERDTRGGAKR